MLFCVVVAADRSVLKITEEEFSSPPVDVRVLCLAITLDYVASLFASLMYCISVAWGCNFTQYVEF